MRTSLILSLLLLFIAAALPAQQTRIDATRLVRPSATASRIYVTNSSGATEWATAAQILTAGSGISISGNTISVASNVPTYGSSANGRIPYYTNVAGQLTSNSLFYRDPNLPNYVIGELNYGLRIGTTTAVNNLYNEQLTIKSTYTGAQLYIAPIVIDPPLPTASGQAEALDNRGICLNTWGWNGGLVSGRAIIYADRTGDGLNDYAMVFGLSDLNGNRSAFLFQGNGQNGYNITVPLSNTTHSFRGLNNSSDFNARFVNSSQNIIGVGITNDGKLAVNTLSPTQPLDVDGNARFRAGIFDNANTAGTSGQTLKSTGTAVQWATDEHIGNTNLTLSANRTLTFGGFNLTYTTGTNSLILDASGATGTEVSPLITRGKEASPVTNALESQDNTSTWRLRLRTTATEARWLTNSRSTYIEGLNYVALNTTASGENYWYWNSNATAQWAPRTTDPTANNYTIWANSTATRFKYKATGAAKTVASLEDDIVGTYDLATGNITLGTNLKQEVDANAGAITVTVGSAMIEGVSYVFRCRRNGTNTVTLSAEAGYSIAIDGTNTIPGSSSIVLGGAGATGIQAPFKIYKITRYGTLIFLQ